MRRLLEDSVETRFKLIESTTGEDGRTKARGIVQRFDTLNGNNRVYPKSFFEKLLREDGAFMNRIQSRSVLGQIEHPADGLPDLRKAAVVMTDCGFVDRFPGMREELRKIGEDPDTAVVAEFESLSTPDGKIVEALWMDDVQTGASSRAQGSVVRNEGSKYPQFPSDADIVQDDVDEDTIVWDIVARPSTPGAYPARVMEALHEAQEYYNREQIARKVANRPHVPLTLGESKMDLMEIRTTLSRLKPKFEGLEKQSTKNLLAFLKDLDNLSESLSSVTHSLNESQQVAAADSKGEIQALKDRIIAALEAMSEAEPERLPGATGMKTSKSPSVDELDVLPTVGKKGQNLSPGGAEGQGHIEDPDGKANDGTPPGPGVKPGATVPSGPTGQASGKIIGQESMAAEAYGSDITGPIEAPGKDKKIKGAKGTEVAYQDKNQQTSRRPKKGEHGMSGIVASQEGGQSNVDEMGGGKRHGKPGYSKPGQRSQEMSHDEEDEDYGKDEMDMDGDAEENKYENMTSVNTDLVNECRALRRDIALKEQQLKSARDLAIATGKQHRKSQFETAMERLVEANPSLDHPACRKALETASDPKHLFQIAEAILGGRAKVRAQEDVSLEIQVESDGLYRLIVGGTPHQQIFAGTTLYQTLQKMGISETDIEANFASAHGVTVAKTGAIAEQDDEEDTEFDFGDDAGADAGDDYVDNGDDYADNGEMDMDMGGEEDNGANGGDTFEVPPGVEGAPDAQAYVLVPMDKVDNGEDDGMDAGMDAGMEGGMEGGEEVPDFGGMESKGGKSKYKMMMEGWKKKPTARKSLTEGQKRRSRKGRMSEALPPPGVKPRAASKPPQVNEVASSQPANLMERVIQRQKTGS